MTALPDINQLTESLSFLEKVDPSKPLHLVVYSDGGAIMQDNVAGLGLHGYFYHDEEVKHKSGCPKGYPTKRGYVVKRSDKMKLVPVIGFFDYCYSEQSRTNNYMELLGAYLAGLLTLSYPVESVTLLSDSKYVIDNTEKYLEKWVSNNFISNGKEIANRGLWEAWYDVYTKVKEHTKLKMIWVKGHDGEVGNSYADSNATCAMRMLRSELTEDISTSYARAGEPKVYHEREHGLSPLLTERRLIMGNVKPELPYYYQLTMGKRWASTEEERREQIGKRISDTLVSVVKLKERDPVIDRLDEISRQVKRMDNITVTRLDLLGQGDLYDSIKDTMFRTLQLRDNKLLTANGVELVNELSKARLSWRILPVFESLTDVLDQYLSDDLIDVDQPFTYTDITDQLYGLSHTKKGDIVHNFTADDDDLNVRTVTVDTPNAEGQHIKLTCGIDLPSPLGLKRLAKLKPKVVMACWTNLDSKRIVHYATIIEVGEEIGVWMSAYTNMHILHGVSQ